MRTLVGLFGVGMLMLAAVPSSAQRAADPLPAGQDAGRSSVEERAQQLKAVVPSVTSPDRDLNIANFEQLMESGDARRIEIAIRTLVSSDDPVLRGMAMRGYIAVTRDLVLEAVLNQAEMKVLTEARAQPDGVRNLHSPYAHLSQMATVGFKFPLVFEITSIKEPRGKVMEPYYKQPVNYTVRGDRITFAIAAMSNVSVKCEFELAPKKDATIGGTMTCPHEYFTKPVIVAAPMF